MDEQQREWDQKDPLRLALRFARIIRDYQDNCRNDDKKVDRRIHGKQKCAFI